MTRSDKSDCADTRRGLRRLSYAASAAVLIFISLYDDALAADRSSDTCDTRAQNLVSQLGPEEQLGLLRGFEPHLLATRPRPVDLKYGEGYVPGNARLDIPALNETDASLGIANQGGVIRPNDVATALPSAEAMAATWDADLVETAGRMIGGEARAKGFDVLLAGGVNLVREPRNGRNFEYFGEDPLLAGTLAGHAIRGVQSNHIVSTIKHFALNDQETGRGVVSADIAEAAMRESDLLAFEIGIEVGQPASVMCSYNRVNGVYACENSFLLKEVLRREWGFKGWTMSDWGAVHSVSITQGLDQESGTQSKDTPWYGTNLQEALAAGTVPADAVTQAATRVIHGMCSVGLLDNPVAGGEVIDYEAHAEVAEKVAEEGIVLLKNARQLLPLASAHRILIVGGHADKGVLAGGGSSQVYPYGGAGLALPIPGQPIYHKRIYDPSSPVDELRKLLPNARISFDDGTDPQRAAAAARDADVTIVFAEQFMAEGRDASTLTLPDDQDGLIDAVASASPKTVVVLETGGAVFMPWIDKVGAVVEAWYPGQHGGLALARILSGAASPSGRLPLTFPARLDQLPNPDLPGAALLATQAPGSKAELPPFDLRYPEGSDVGYRWYDRKGAMPLFAFGHGLTYTSFGYADLKVSAGKVLSISFIVTNTGAKPGVEIAQAYARINGARRLIGWDRVELKAGEHKQISISADQRLLSGFDVGQQKWHLVGRTYAVEVGRAVNEPLLAGSVKLDELWLNP